MGRVLNAGVEGGRCRIGPEVQKLEIVFILLRRSYSGRPASDRVDVEFGGSITET